LFVNQRNVSRLVFLTFIWWPCLCEMYAPCN
jgi:hypothetical protein